MRVRYLLSALVAASLSTPVHSQIFGGVEFPDGERSFADEVVDFAPGEDVGEQFLDSSNALGPPDWNQSELSGAASLGNEGELVLRFVDNALALSGDDSPDLWVFEIGTVTEFFNLSVSSDGNSWLDLGDIRGQPTGIDLDAVGGLARDSIFSFVRLRDVEPGQTGFPFGEADIDAVGAISSVAPPQIVPLPPAVFLFASAIVLVGFVRSRRVG